MECGCRSSLTSCASSSAISIACPTRRSSRAASSSITSINSPLCAASNCESLRRLVIAAMIEVSGVRSSCATESSSALRSRSLSREASSRDSVSTAPARSIAIAVNPHTRSQCPPAKSPNR